MKLFRITMLEGTENITIEFDTKADLIAYVDAMVLMGAKTSDIIREWYWPSMNDWYVFEDSILPKQGE